MLSSLSRGRWRDIAGERDFLQLPCGHVGVRTSGGSYQGHRTWKWSLCDFISLAWWHIGEKSPSMAHVQHPCGPRVYLNHPTYLSHTHQAVCSSEGLLPTPEPRILLHVWGPTECSLSALQTGSSLAMPASLSAVQWSIHTFSSECWTLSKYVLFRLSLSPSLP